MGMSGIVIMWIFFIVGLIVLNCGTYDKRTK